MKKTALFTLLLLVCVLWGKAQPKPNITAYFDGYWVEVKDPAKATFYRTVDKVKGKFMVRDYYKSGQLQMEALCDAVKPKLKWDAPTVLYHRNGIKQEEGPFKDSERYGFHRYWYDNGAPQKEVFYKNVAAQVYYQYWTRDGKALLTNGSGVIQEENRLGATLYQEIKDSLVFASFRIDAASRDSIYNIVEQPSAYQGGHDALRKDLTATLKYPDGARRAKVEGTVFVSFIVDKDGSVREAKVLKGIGAGCDTEAVRAVSTLKSWLPAKQRGKAVNSMFVLPVKFDLKGWSLFGK